MNTASGTNGEENRTILILGCGNFQIDAIKLCKERGFRVIGCSYTNTDPGIPLLDGFRQVDIKDIEGVTAYAREEHASIVYSVGSDIAIPTAIKASEELGLPHFFSYETACRCQDKGLSRKYLKDTEWSIPYVVAKTAEEAKSFAAYPAMMKPVDSQGQRGCFRVTCPEDIDANFETSVGYAQSGEVIIEHFIDGPEISVNAFLHDGELLFFMPSDRYSFSEFPGGIIKEHGLPCTAIDDVSREKVRQLVIEVADLMGIKEGPAYYQIKLDGNQPRLIEVAPRLDGCHMWRFVKTYCGYDLLAASFDLLIDGIVDEPGDVTCEKGDWRLTFMSSVPNVPFDSSQYDTEGAVYVQRYYQDGDNVRSLNGHMEKCGYYIHRL